MLPVGHQSRILFFPFPPCDWWLQEKRLSDLSNQSHDSAASNSTASANSHEERRGLMTTDLVGGRGPQEEEELDEMEVEYVEVSFTTMTVC